ncbi:MAG: Crp/Fnr family transcriptional regulator [Chitinophagaceae bacterium]|nr:MAG: Crp/Fnr family transcriptional regulator [Chitinophagaceae bacterium]
MNIPPAAVLSRYRSNLATHCRVDDAAWELLEPILEVRTIARSGYLLEEGKTCRSIDYIDSGAFRHFHRQDGLEVTTGLYTDGSFVTDMKSLRTAGPATGYIQALEDAVIVRLYKSKLVDLYAASAGLQAVGRALLEAMVIRENEWKEMYTRYDPAQRYAFLQRHAPELLQRVPLQYIASFLGIRRETLSRIRGRY